MIIHILLHSLLVMETVVVIVGQIVLQVALINAKAHVLVVLVGVTSHAQKLVEPHVVQVVRHFVMQTVLQRVI